MKFGTIEDLAVKMEIIRDIFFAVRVVDPGSEKVIHTLYSSQNEKPYPCYEFWGKEQACENCISMQAYRENRTVTKIEGSNRGIFSVTALPVTIGGRRLTLELIQNVTENIYFENSGRLRSASQIIRSVGKHIDNLILTDELTGLYNRRFINERLPVLFSDVLQGDLTLSVVYIDVDHFKNINDHYGHDAGDYVLVKLSEVLRSKLRKNSGWVARYGGDEFVLCLPGADHSTAKAIAEALRVAIASEAFWALGSRIMVTCSFGVQTISPTDQVISLQEFLAVADRNLYHAKELGRNIVV